MQMCNCQLREKALESLRTALDNLSGDYTENFFSKRHWFLGKVSIVCELGLISFSEREDFVTEALNMKREVLPFG